MSARRSFGVRTLLAGVLSVAVAAPLVPMGSAGARPNPPHPDAAGPPTATPGGNDLATIQTDRWIVQLTEDPAASYEGGTAGLAATAPEATGAESLDVAAPAVDAYRSHLSQSQSSAESAIARVAAGARVERHYSLVLNGLAVRMSPADAAAVRALPGVASVTPDVPYRLDMFSTPQQIGAPSVWEKVGGQANAGAGVKVAIIDSGIYLDNACFDDAGYTLPAGYPKGEAAYTNNKVIVARNYVRSDDPPVAGEDTPLPGPDGSSHGTHVAGTVACNANTPVVVQGSNLTISGVAPKAYLMNYKVFYKSQSPDDFQNENAYVAELVQAIEDAVADGADVMSNSWGSSYQNTLAWPDPMVQAAEAATDAGVVMVFAQGNSGPDTATGNSPANSPKVIAVGAVSKNTTVSPGLVSVTGPAPVPDNLTDLDVGAAEFGAPAPETLGPLPVVSAASLGNGLGCAPFPAGSLTGKIAVIERGTCEFTDKVANAQIAGALAAFVYNSAGGGDNLQSMGPGARADEVTIPSWFLRRSDGQAIVAFATANPSATAAFTLQAHPAVNVGDVMAPFSSVGPTQDKTLKPDVVAPGVDIISSGYANADFPDVYLGFGSSSGTSMATPHVAGAAALLLQLHPTWRPFQVKSALMTTATEAVYLDTAKTVRAGALERGAGRIDLASAASPGLLFSRASLSGGELAAGKGISHAVVARNVSGRTETWDVSARTDPELRVAMDTTTITLAPGASARIVFRLTTPFKAEPGDYDGSIIFKNRASPRQLHIPVWQRVIPTEKVAQVLLVDDDGSGFAPFTDYGPFYQDLFDGLGVTYDYIDVDAEFFPGFYDLFAYDAVVMFTGDNDSFNTSGLFPGDQNALSEWLDSGGRLWMLGQNLAEATDSGDFESPSLGRARLYHGYLGLRYDTGSLFPAGAPEPTADGAGFLAGLTLDLVGGDAEQDSIEAFSPLGDTDTFNAASTMVVVADPRDGTPGGSAIATARASAPGPGGLPMFRYRTVAMGFGLEGLDSSSGGASAEEVATKTLAWLLA